MTIKMLCALDIYWSFFFHPRVFKMRRKDRLIREEENGDDEKEKTARRKKVMP